MVDPEIKETDLALWVGAALTAWSAAEYELSKLFAHTLRAENNIGAIRAFNALHAFDNKLRITNESAQTAFQSEALFQKRWVNIYNRLSNHKDKRNAVVHGRIVPFAYQKQNDGTTIRLPPALQPAYGVSIYGSAKKSRSSPPMSGHPADAITLNQLKEFTREFRKDGHLIKVLTIDYETSRPK